MSQLKNASLKKSCQLLKKSLKKLSWPLDRAATGELWQLGYILNYIFILYHLKTGYKIGV